MLQTIKNNTQDSHLDSLCPDADPEIVELEHKPHHHNDDLHNDLSLQMKEKEAVYTPREWVTDKLNQVKSSSTLSAHTHVVSHTIKTIQNVSSMEIITCLNKKAIMEFHFFEGGIVKLNCINPTLPCKFSFEMIDKPANLSPYNIEEKLAVRSTYLEVVFAESESKFVAEFNPFIVKMISTRDNNEQVLFEMNSTQSLVFDENLCADFTFFTDSLYGLPLRACDFRIEDTRQGLPYRFCNTDIPVYPIGSRNSLYGAMPMIISRNQDNPTLVSMYWQNCSDTYVDIHKSDTDTRAYWLSERGNLECYICISQSAKQHYKNMSNLFGHSFMPQYFSLGYHQCRWSYEDQQDVLQVNQGFNDHDIPCDSITLDINHTDACRYFTWNEKDYPDPIAMQKTLVDNGRQLITITDPHILVDPDYHVYAEAAQHELYVKNNDHTPFVGKCWPGDCIYMDFLNDKTREAWGDLYKHDRYKYSTPNVWAWNDMNEPSVFEQKGNHMPRECLHTIKSHDGSFEEFQVEHREVHNAYGYSQNKATFEGMLKRNKDQNIRPFALSRSFYAGSQKYTIIWTGDTGTTWDYLRVSMPQLLSLSLCGLSFCGSDIAGFNGNPEPELAVRWHQLGVFMPFFRGHSEITNNRREPWMYPQKHARIIRECIIDRYRLLPYWYSCFESHCRTAIPLMRPVWLEQENVLEASNMDDQQRFMLGDALLVVPVLDPNVSSLHDPLKGIEGRWYDYYTFEEVVRGKTIIIGLERIGCFIKGGSIVPKFDIKSGVKSSKDAREKDIHLFVGVDNQDSARGVMYVDDGDTYGFKKGDFSRKDIQFEKKTLTWRHDEGNGYSISNKVTKVVIMGLKEKVQTGCFVERDGEKQKLEVTQYENSIVLEFSVPVNSNWKLVLE